MCEFVVLCVWFLQGLEPSFDVLWAVVFRVLGCGFVGWVSVCCGCCEAFCEVVILRFWVWGFVVLGWWWLGSCFLVFFAFFCLGVLRFLRFFRPLFIASWFLVGVNLLAKPLRRVDHILLRRLVFVIRIGLLMHGLVPSVVIFGEQLPPGAE